MQVHYDEGVAIHIDPEPCVGVREDGDEPYARIGPVRICAGALSNERPLYVADCLANRQIC